MASLRPPTFANRSVVVTPDRITLSSGWIVTEDAAGRSALIGRRPEIAASQPLVAAAFETDKDPNVAADRRIEPQDAAGSTSTTESGSAKVAVIDFRLGDAPSTGIVIDRFWLQADASQIAESPRPSLEQVAVQLRFDSYDILHRARRPIDLSDAADVPAPVRMLDSIQVDEAGIEIDDSPRTGDSIETDQDGGGRELPAFEPHDHVQTIVAIGEAESLREDTTIVIAIESQDASIAGSSLDVAIELQSVPQTLRRSKRRRPFDVFAARRGIPSGGGFTFDAAASPDQDSANITIVDSWLGGAVHDVEAKADTEPLESQRDVSLLVVARFDGCQERLGEQRDWRPQLIGAPLTDLRKTIERCASEKICQSGRRADAGCVHHAAAALDGFGAGRSAAGDRFAQFTPPVLEIVAGGCLDDAPAEMTTSIVITLGSAPGMGEAGLLDSDPFFDRGYDQHYRVAVDSKGNPTGYDFLLRPDRPDRLRSAWVLKSRVPRLRRRRRHGSMRRGE